MDNDKLHEAIVHQDEGELVVALEQHPIPDREQPRLPDGQVSIRDRIK